MPNRFACTSLLLASITLASCSHQPVSDGSYQRYMRLAGDLQKGGDMQSAAVLYEKATQEPDARLEAWLKLGEARLASGDARAAERAYQQALEYEPDNTAALLGVGTAQLHQGKLNRAVTSLSQASAGNDQPEAFNRQGVAQMLRGQPAAAQVAFIQSLALAPTNLDTQCNLALAYALDGQSQQALQTIQTVRESPRAQASHQRNALLVLVLSGREADLKTQRVEDITPAQYARLLTEARRIKAIQDPAMQARELGMINSR
ncbi:tetratricopeptide repeat protein [Pseudomonas fluorescens]|uniref:Tetratricopeptide repeat protein n=1 Tax=Pseudomonas fluorescens TaxID=294 RepID=A0A944DE24_PSEFL|nr:tetratricopeptide repeat protein [Pseudomonas fluorescens]MBT2297572.1 tetratricopeptide repeat protein [Pseudomonas fluorescens]MBT2305770.1 tetratricopeptide repeat protein [Pseudomonas fluorescens]MBT2314207.1 tetratricopeptide repeat protein [Pseudomonas fluorescens]MBT2319301.1 tetratricopeptide repeat protein [Pseudomonas fluorescens]MBT2327511.1 tetratricopeptide repeat protein [Pseudomonas fluorescens]